MAEGFKGDLSLISRVLELNMSDLGSIGSSQANIENWLLFLKIGV